MKWHRLLVCAMTIAAGAIVAAHQTPTFSAKADEVRVDVLVTDHGKPVRGLKPEDFEVRDNGVMQSVHLADFGEAPVNAVLALDMSASVTGERLDQLRRGGHTLLAALKPDDQSALVTFSHVVGWRTALTHDFGRVGEALDRAEPAGRTSVIDASYAGLMAAASDAGRALVIVFSDGLDTSSWLTPDAVVDAAKRGGAVVYSVSAGQLPARAFLRNLSGVTGGSVFEVESTKNLSAVFAGVLDEFRLRYVLSYSPAGVVKSGWHALDVRVKGRNLTVKARPGYLAGLLN